jgi:hypothetical protein
MKRYPCFFLAIFLAFAFTPEILCQVDQIDFLAGGVDDAELISQRFLNPLGNALGANLNSGWYCTAKPHKLGGFDIRISASTAWAPDMDRTYNVGDLHLSNDVDNPGGISPTVAGEKTDSRPELVYAQNVPGVGSVEYARFTLPNGTGVKYMPLPMLQAGIGLPFGTDVAVRYLPNVDLGKSNNIGLWGVGLKHSISQHIPGLKKLPVLDISAQGAYTHLSTYANINYFPSDIVVDENHDYVNDPDVWLDQKLEMDVTAWTVNLVVSETLPVISFYQAIGYSNSVTDLAFTGNYPFPVIEDNPGSPYFGEVVVNDIEGEGIINNPISLEMLNNKDFRINAGMCLTLGVFVFHVDYTKANYSAVTVGMGVSFR